MSGLQIATLVTSGLDVIGISFVWWLTRRSPYRERWQQLKDALRGRDG